MNLIEQNLSEKYLPGFVIESTTIAVDLWSREALKNFNLTHCFLTHAHQDHMKNLNSNWNGPIIYCSEVTKKLLLAFKSIKKNLIQVLKCNQRYKMQYANGAKFYVTALDANHCPGAYMFLFESEQFGNVLATGDFRYNSAMFNEKSPLKKIKIDVCYLDNTYWSPSYSNLPSRENAYYQIVDLIDTKCEQFGNLNPLFAIKMNNLGKEEMLLKLCEDFNALCAISKNRMQRYSIVLGTKNMKWFTNQINTDTMFFVQDDASTLNIGNQNIISINPSALFIKRDKSMSIESLRRTFLNQSISSYQIPYTDHSSFNELIEFVKKLRPGRVVQTVASSQKISYDMNKLNKYLLTQAEKTQKDLLEIPRREFSCVKCNKWWFANSGISNCKKCNKKFNPIPVEEEFGICHFECKCGNTFRGFASKKIGSSCYKCKNVILPVFVLDKDNINRKNARNGHSCARCNGNGKCPIYFKVLYPSGEAKNKRN